MNNHPVHIPDCPEIDEIFAEAPEESEDEADETIRNGYYYYSLRLHFDEDPCTEESIEKGGEHSATNLKKQAQPFIDKILELYVHGQWKHRWIAGIERKDKCGFYARPHLHFNFVSSTVKPTIQAELRRLHLVVQQCQLKGNNMYSLQQHVLINDEWWRYPLKQFSKLRSGLNLTDRGNFPSKLAEMHKRAHDQWLIGIPINQKKMAGKTKKLELYDRMTEFIEKDKKPTSVFEVCLGMNNFYLFEKRAINPNTVEGYVRTYCLTNKLMSVSQFSQKMENKIMGY